MNAPSKVFVGGSRRISRLNQRVKNRLLRIIDKGLTVIIGDANGADKAVQGFLANQSYENVVVFHMAGECRNNLGNWATREIAAPRGARHDAGYFGTKDRAMGVESDYGFMLWDGKSKGTLSNVEDLIRMQKPVVVYLDAYQSFVNLRNANQLAKLLDRSHVTAAHRPARRIHPDADALLF